jgi:hypothetical protein
MGYYAKTKIRPSGAETIFPNYFNATPGINHVKVFLIASSRCKRPQLKEKRKKMGPNKYVNGL